MSPIPSELGSLPKVFLSQTRHCCRFCHPAQTAHPSQADGHSSPLHPSHPAPPPFYAFEFETTPCSPPCGWFVHRLSAIKANHRIDDEWRAMYTGGRCPPSIWTKSLTNLLGEAGPIYRETLGSGIRIVAAGTRLWVGLARATARTEAWVAGDGRPGCVALYGSTGGTAGVKQD